MANIITSPQRNSSFNANKLNNLNIKKAELSKSVEITDHKLLNSSIKLNS